MIFQLGTETCDICGAKQLMLVTEDQMYQSCQICGQSSFTCGGLELLGTYLLKDFAWVGFARTRTKPDHFYGYRVTDKDIDRALTMCWSSAYTTTSRPVFNTARYLSNIYSK